MPLYLGTQLISDVYVGLAASDISTTALNVTANGTYTPISGTYYSSVDVNVPVGSTINNQNKSVTPSTASQSVSADTGYTGLGTVTVNPIPSEFIVPSGTLNITENGTYNVKTYTTASVSIEVGSTINNQAATATPTESSQLIEFSEPYTGLSSVYINPISNTYVGSQVTRKTATTYTPGTTNQTIAANTYLTGIQTIAGDADLVAGNIKSGVNIFGVAGTYAGTNRADTATPSESAQTITPGTGYTGLSSVYIKPISSTYVGSQVATRSSSSLTVSGATVYAPPGYYSATASKAIAAGSAATPATTVTANPSINVSASGLISVTASASKQIAPTVSAGYVSSGTTGTITVRGSNTMQLSTIGATAVTPSTTTQTLSVNGYYMIGNVTVNPIPSNYITTNDANATAADINEGKTAYVNGSIVTGTQAIHRYYTGTATPGVNLGSDGDIYLQVSGA